MKKTMKAVIRNYRYYITITNDSNAQRCIENLGINPSDIIDFTINDDCTKFIVTTNKTCITGYEKKEVIPSYDDTVFSVDDITGNTINSFVDRYYSVITIAIIKSMYNSNKSLNYNAVRSIVENGYNDSLIDDLKQCVYITLWENLKAVDTYNFKQLRENVDNCVYWSNPTLSFTSFDNGSLWLACYRSVSTYLYHTNTKDTYNRHSKTIIDEAGNKKRVEWLEPRKISFEHYDTNNKDESPKLLTIDTYAYRHYLSQDYNRDATNNEVIAVWDILDRVLAYILKTEKIKIYNGCKEVLNGLMNGDKMKDISLNTGLSSTTVTKYYNILKNAYYELYKKPLYHTEKNNNNITSIINHSTITIDFKGLKDIIDNNSRDTVLERVNAYYHAVKQAFYNDLFGVPTKSKINDMEHAAAVVTNYVYNGKYSDNTYNAMQTIINR